MTRAELIAALDAAGVKDDDAVEVWNPAICTVVAIVGVERSEIGAHALIEIAFN